LSGKSKVIIGIDWGSVRVGVAATDELGLLAHPVACLKNLPEAKLAAEIAALAKKLSAAKIVMGLPTHLDGRENKNAQTIRLLAARLENAAGVPVVLTDERLTSWQAAGHLKDNKRSASKKSGDRDLIAACLILQNYVNGQKIAPQPHGT
jgi:putative Holliday junction resolvase